MIIICSEEERNFIENKCDGRCVDGKWCVFADGKEASWCPIENKGIISMKKHKDGCLEIND